MIKQSKREFSVTELNAECKFEKIFAQNCLNSSFSFPESW